MQWLAHDVTDCESWKIFCSDRRTAAVKEEIDDTRVRILYSGYVYTVIDVSIFLTFISPRTLVFISYTYISKLNFAYINL